MNTTCAQHIIRTAIQHLPILQAKYTTLLATETEQLKCVYSTLTTARESERTAEYQACSCPQGPFDSRRTGTKQNSHCKSSFLKTRSQFDKCHPIQDFLTDSIKNLFFWHYNSTFCSKLTSNKLEDYHLHDFAKDFDMCLLTLEDCKEYDSIDYRNITLHFNNVNFGQVSEDLN